MRVVPSSEFPAEYGTMYFDQGSRGRELVIREEDSPTFVPEVVVLEGLSYVAEVKRAEGGVELAEHNGLDWSQTYAFEQGAVVQKITGFNEKYPLTYNEQMDLVFKDAPQSVSEHVMDDSDLLIMQKRGVFSRKHAVVPAAAPLPQFKEQQYETFVPTGVITKENTLIGWGDESRGWPYLLDLVIADAHATELKDRMLLYREVGDYSLVGRVVVASTVKAYLEHYRDQTGRSFLPK